MKTHFLKKIPRVRGFALVVTLTLMVLLATLALGLLSLSSVALRTGGIQSDLATARANARMALSLAIAELQKHAGPDQRVTARADLLNESSPNPAWTGAWDTSVAGATPRWLVSGQDPDPSVPVSSGAKVVLFNPDTSAAAKQPVNIPLVRIKGSSSEGNYAWWVGDEGVKARVDLSVPASASTPLAERRVRSMSPLAPDLSTLGDDFQEAKFGAKGSVNKRLLASIETVGLAAAEKNVPRIYFDDITTGGFGLPVNVRDGGFKTDLSLVFDRSQQSQPFVSGFLGGTPSPASMSGSKFYRFSVSDTRKFYLSDKLVGNIPEGTGPNWGNLFSYARLWENTASGSLGLIAADPRVESDLRQDNWLPFMRAQSGTSFQQDIQQTNSAVNPVISVLQIGFMMGAKPGPPRADGTKRYQPQLLVKPILGLWNPYNVAIKANTYQIEWAIAPYFRLDFQKPSPNGSFPTGSGNVTEMWLRDYWRIGPKLPTGGNSQGGSYMRLRTTSVDFQPGEFRLFSVQANPSISGDFNTLVPTLDPKGAFTLDIIRSVTKGTAPEDGAGQPLLVDEGFWGWFGDVYLQDTHWDNSTAAGSEGTKQHFKNQLDLNAAKSWVTLKADGSNIHLNRYTNIWNGGKDETAKKPYTPEPIVTARNRLTTSGASGKTPHRIEQLAGGNFGHVGTWRFYTRNPTEIDDPGQGARGWIDSNPLTLSSSVKLDGSKNTSAIGIEGWNAMAHLIAGAHRTGAKSGDVGDGGGGNRGLVSEGSYNNPIPQGVPTPGRWQGYGGPGSTAFGYTHVIAYDVPRSPLVSVGQFQSAQLSRYNFEPGFVLGNSYANPRIPLGATSQENYSGINGFRIVDTSHQVNERLWDSVFFSTMGLDYLGKSSGKFDDEFDFKGLVLGSKTLPNPRMVFSPVTGDTSIDGILSKSATLAPQAIAARIAVSGAFNVNSTSVSAWKAVLSSMSSSELPSVNPASGALSWNDPAGVRFNRFGHTIGDKPAKGTAKEAAFWQGWRELSADDLEDLAEAIVEEVRERGPFLSFADFVNRDPDASEQEHQRKGALQAALDRAINNKLPADIGLKAQNPPGGTFSAAVANENQAAGHASYLLQGDLLQSLSPIMQVRSDYFRIRTYGEALDGKGNVTAAAWCEAFVQRNSQYIDPAEKPEVAFANLNTSNKVFGRQFRIVSFRWLSPEEI